MSVTKFSEYIMSLTLQHNSLHLPQVNWDGVHNFKPCMLREIYLGQGIKEQRSYLPLLNNIVKLEI